MHCFKDSLRLRPETSLCLHRAGMRIGALTGVGVSPGVEARRMSEARPQRLAVEMRGGVRPPSGKQTLAGLDGAP